MDGKGVNKETAPTGLKNLAAIRGSQVEEGNVGGIK
jgi:hypothetical protein